jgi:hypothetical protein
LSLYKRSDIFDFAAGICYFIANKVDANKAEQKQRLSLSGRIKKETRFYIRGI